jgi:diacylglycerol kinase family enzyme
VVVVNATAGPDTAEADTGQLRQVLPLAEVAQCGPDEDLGTVLDEAANRAAAHGGALGICGGDGSVNAAAGRAAARGLSLAVFPGGTLNHFALDLGIERFEDTAAAVAGGDALASSTSPSSSS